MLSFSSTRDNETPGNQNFETYRVNRDGSNLTRLTLNESGDTPTGAWRDYDSASTWSPVGTRILFTSGRTKLRVSRARVLRADRRLDVLAPITSRAEGDVAVTFHADDRMDTFDADVSEANTELEVIRFVEPITAGQARLGTGIVNLTYLGDEDTRPEFVRLRAASQPAELDVEEISLIGDRLSATGSVTDDAEGVVRLRLSYSIPTGRPTSMRRAPRSRTTVTGRWRMIRSPPSWRSVAGTCRSSSPATSSGASAASSWPTSSTRARPAGRR